MQLTTRAQEIVESGVQAFLANDFIAQYGHTDKKYLRGGRIGLCVAGAWFHDAVHLDPVRRRSVRAQPSNSPEAFVARYFGIPLEVVGFLESGFDTAMKWGDKGFEVAFFNELHPQESYKPVQLEALRIGWEIGNRMRLYQRPVDQVWLEAHMENSRRNRQSGALQSIQKQLDRAEVLGVIAEAEKIASEPLVTT